MKYIKITLLVLLIFWRYSRKKRKKKALKKKALKMTSQLVIFRAFYLFFRPPDPRSEKKNPVYQLIKKIWPKLPEPTKMC